MAFEPGSYYSYWRVAHEETNGSAPFYPSAGVEATLPAVTEKPVEMRTVGIHGCGQDVRFIDSFLAAIRSPRRKLLKPKEEVDDASFVKGLDASFSFRYSREESKRVWYCQARTPIQEDFTLPA
jgi:hypothetical protein